MSLDVCVRSVGLVFLWSKSTINRRVVKNHDECVGCYILSWFILSLSLCCHFLKLSPVWNHTCILHIYCSSVSLCSAFLMCQMCKCNLNCVAERKQTGCSLSHTLYQKPAEYTVSFRKPQDITNELTVSFISVLWIHCRLSQNKLLALLFQVNLDFSQILYFWGHFFFLFYFVR